MPNVIATGHDERDAAGGVVRFLEVAGLLALLGCRFVPVVAIAALRGGRSAARACIGACLPTVLETLGPTYIKIGQILSSRADLLSTDIVGPLGRLQDAVVTPERGRVEDRLRLSLGPERTAAFRSVEAMPFAAASIAQVHRGVLGDGRTVAVKIRRNAAARQVRRDFQLLNAVVTVLGRLPGMRSMPLAEILAEVRTAITDQLNFRKEVKSNLIFRAHFRHSERIRFAEVIEELSSEDVITMVLVPDTERVTQTTLSIAERQAAAVAGLRALFRMIFIDGFVHADMHPGNVLLRPGGELVILDTGLTAELSFEDRHRFADFFFALVNNRGERCAEVVLEMASWTGPRFLWSAFCADMQQLIARYAALPSAKFEVPHFVYELIDLQRRHQLRGSPAFVMTILGMVVYDGICKTLHPECNFQEIARGFIILSKYERRLSFDEPPSRGEITSVPANRCLHLLASTRSAGSSA